MKNNILIKSILGGFGLVLSASLSFGLILKDNQYSQSKADSFMPDSCRITSISAGTNHNLALDQYGNLWAWGNNSAGQLGDGTKTNSNVPIQIMKGHKFKKISAGNDCSAAIDVDGYLYGWGSKINPTKAANVSPTKVSTTDKYKDIICGYDTSVGLLVTDYSPDYLYGYGIYSCSQTYVNSNATYYELKSTNYPGVYGTQYRYTNQGNGTSNYTDAGERIVSADGNFYYKSRWGYHSGPYYYYWDNFLIKESGSLVYLHSASKNNGTSSSIPSGYVETVFFKDLDVSSLEDIHLTNVSTRKVMNASSTTQSSVYFVDNNGDVYSAGLNTSLALLGNGDTETVSTTIPAKINSLSNIKAVSAGQNHVIAIDEDGKVYSWGDNTYGQLGHGDNGSYVLPTKIHSFDINQSFNITAFAGETFEGSIAQYGSTNYSINQNGSKGTMSIDSDGNFTYEPNAGAFGEDSLTITIYYGSTSVIYFVNVFIDRKPVVMGGTNSLSLECGESINGSIPCTDEDNDPLTYTFLQNPNKGTVVFNNNSGSFTYTARADVAGGDSFVVGISDGYCTVEYPVTIHVHSLITFDDDTEFNIDLNQTTTYSSNVNALDIDGDTLSYSVLSNGSKGTVTIDSSGNYTYTANGNFYGEDTFTIRVDDGYKPLDIEYTVHLYSVVDGGTVVAAKITQGTTYNGQISTIAKGAEPHYSINQVASKGSVTIDESTGEYTYIPNEGTIGSDVFVVLVDYGYDQYVISITIYQNTIPDDSNVVVNLIINENENYSGTAQCVDLDGDILRYYLNTQPTKGSLSINETTGEYTYYPTNNIAGNDLFKVDVFDGTDTITIDFVIHIESEIQLNSVIYETISQNTSLSNNVHASDKDGDTLVYSIATGASNGVANIDSLTGDYVYIPFNNFYGNDSFVVKVDDGVSPKMCTVNVRVNRKPTTDQLTINLVTQGITATGTAACSDPDGDLLTYSIVESPTLGNAIIDSTNGNFAYTPNLDAAGDDSFKINVTDGTDNIVITVNIHNETDVYLEDQPTQLVANQGKTTNGQVYAVDLDGDSLTYSMVSYPTQGTVNLNSSTGAWAYNAKSNAAGTDAFSVKVTDGRSEVVISYSLVINTPAEFNESSYSIATDQNNNYTGQVVATDGDGDSLTYSIVSQGQKGIVTIDSSTGRYLYSPNENAAGNDSFVLGVSDGNFVTEVVISVHIESDITIPYSTISQTTEKNGVVTGNVNASDLDGDNLTYAIYQQGNKGNASVMGDGGYSYFANNGAGDDSFVVSVTDGIHTKYITIYVHISSNPYFEESAMSISVPQNGSVTGQVHGVDEDGDALQYSISTQPTNGYVNLNSNTGAFVYTAYSNSTASEDTFIISVTDGNSVSNVVVTVIINNAPVVSDTSINIKQGGSGNGLIDASDPEHDTLVYSIYSQGSYGTASINSSTGEYTYVTTDRNYNGKDSFVVSVSDGYTTKNVVVQVNIEKNSKPTSSGTRITLKSGTSTTGKLNVSDIDLDELSYTIAYQGDKGTAVIDEKTGEFTYSAFKDTEGYDCFVITVSDGFNEVSFLVEVDIEFVDSNNSWAIPTTIALGSAAAISIGFIAFILLKFGKKIFVRK